MTKRTIIIMLALCLLVSLAGCTKAKPAAQSTDAPTLAPVEPTSAPPTAVPPTAVPPTPLPPTVAPPPAAVPPTIAPLPTSTPAPVVVQEASPVLTSPADGAEDKMFDLMWEWEAELGADEWFELQVWPAREGSEPEVYAWTKAKSVHLTAANLLPGAYNWRVAVVLGRDEARAGEKSPFSEAQTFTVVRPSVLAFLSVTPPPAPRKADLGDAPSHATHLDASSMTAYPAGGPAGTKASFHTLYDPAKGHYGPMHRDPEGGAWLGKEVSLEHNAHEGDDEDAFNNIDLAKDEPDMDEEDDGFFLVYAPKDGQKASFKYDVTFKSGAEKRYYYVNAWFDWNRDGDWGDVIDSADEWAVKNQRILSHARGTYHYVSSQFVAYNPDPDEPMWVRLTLSEVKLDETSRDGRGPEDGYAYGETEDYYVTGVNATPTVVRWYPTYTPTVVPPTATPTTEPTVIEPTVVPPTTVPPTTVPPTTVPPTATSVPPTPTTVPPTPTDVPPTSYPNPTAVPTTEPTSYPGPPTAAPTTQPTNYPQPLATSTPGPRPTSG